MPDISKVRFDAMLTDVSVQYRPGTHIADRVLPGVPVRNRSDFYWVYDKSRFNIPNAKRETRSRYNQIDWTMTRDSYFTEQYGLEQPIDDQERRNAVSPLDLDVDSTEILTDQLLNAREQRVANLVRNTANVTQNVTLAGTAQWSDAVNSKPVNDVAAARRTIQAATGFIPNSMLIPYQVFEYLMINQQVMSYLAEGALVDEQVLSRIFRIPNVIVGSVLYNTAREGQTEVLSDVWGKDVLIYYAEPRPGLKKPSFGYQMIAQDLQTFRYRQDEIDSDIIRVTEIRGEKLVAPQLGYLIKNAIV